MSGKQDMKALGRLGGTATRSKYSDDHYASIGKKGGTATLAQHGEEHFRKIGSAGGKTVSSRPGHAEEVGRKGGLVTKERHGTEHYLKIAAAGGRRSAEKRKKAKDTAAAVAVALVPFEEWLQVVVDVMKDIQKAQPQIANQRVVSGVSCAPTYGDCARLLAAMRGEAMVFQAAELNDDVLLAQNAALGTEAP